MVIGVNLTLKHPFSQNRGYRHNFLADAVLLPILTSPQAMPSDPAQSEHPGARLDQRQDSSTTSTLTRPLRTALASKAIMPCPKKISLQSFARIGSK